MSVCLCRVMTSAMHVSMFKMVRIAKLNVLSRHLLMIHKRVVCVVATASKVALVQLIVLARAAAMPVMLWFMNQAVHIASVLTVIVRRISTQSLRRTTGHAAVMW